VTFVGGVKAFGMINPANAYPQSTLDAYLDSAMAVDYPLVGGLVTGGEGEDLIPVRNKPVRDGQQRGEPVEVLRPARVQHVDGDERARPAELCDRMLGVDRRNVGGIGRLLGSDEDGKRTFRGGLECHPDYRRPPECPFRRSESPGQRR